MPEYQYQAFPKCVYRGTVDNYETRDVADEKELAKAQVEGFGEHPAHRKAERAEAVPPEAPEPPPAAVAELPRQHKRRDVPAEEGGT